MTFWVIVLVIADDDDVMNDREVFPNAPLQLVVFEARYSGGAEAGRESLDAFSSHIGADAQVRFGMPPLMRVADEDTGPESALFQIVDRESTLSVTLWPSSVVVESTDYKHFEAFASVIEGIYGTVAEALQPSVVGRIGLRYVDEFHPDPPVLDLSDWSRWVDHRLVEIAAVANRPLVGLGGGFSVDLGESCMLSFRFTTVPGPAVEATGSLKLRPRPNTPALVLDTDAFWQPPEPQQLTGDGLNVLLSRLHHGARELFDVVITDKSRSLFRTKEAR